MMDPSLAGELGTEWGIDPGSLTLVALRENATFRGLLGDRPCALRLHRPGYGTAGEITAEIEIMSHLSEKGCRVPTPLPALSGEYVAEHGGQLASVLDWIEGETATSHLAGSPGDSAAVLSETGAALAMVHNAVDDWPRAGDLPKRFWDAGGLTGEAPVWGRFWETPDATGGEASILKELRDRLAADLAAKCAGEDFGLIHADANMDNVMVEGGRITLIDFDDCGFGYRLFDIATVMHRHLESPDFGDVQSSVLSGYRRHRHLDTGTLPVFLMVRMATYVGWIADRRNIEDADAKSRRFIERCCRFAERYFTAPESLIAPSGG